MSLSDGTHGQIEGIFMRRQLADATQQLVTVAYDLARRYQAQPEIAGYIAHCAVWQAKDLLRRGVPPTDGRIAGNPRETLPVWTVTAHETKTTECLTEASSRHAITAVTFTREGLALDAVGSIHTYRDMGKTHLYCYPAGENLVLSKPALYYQPVPLDRVEGPLTLLGPADIDDIAPLDEVQLDVRYVTEQQLVMPWQKRPEQL